MNVFPVLAGIVWPVKRTPKFNNIVHKTLTGKVVTGTYQQYPIFDFELSYSYLSAADLQALEGFFIQQGGNLTPFLFDAGLGDNSVDKYPLLAGDGSTKTFQLQQGNTGFALPVAASFGTRTAYVDGNSAAATFESPNPGQVTFTTAPANGASITWSGSYYYQAYFQQSSQEFDEFMHLLYQASTVKLETYR